MEELATSNALKMGEAAVVAEQEKQARAQEMAITISAHSAETERVRKVHITFNMHFSISGSIVLIVACIRD
jgi:hypothetical protein